MLAATNAKMADLQARTDAADQRALERKAVLSEFVACGV
jgi:hypothetical protein